MPKHPRGTRTYKMKITRRTRRDGGTRYLVTLPKRLMDQIDENHDSKVRRGSFEVNEGLLVLRVSKGSGQQGDE